MCDTDGVTAGGQGWVVHTADPLPTLLGGSRLLPWVRGTWHGAAPARLGVGAPLRLDPRRQVGARPDTLEGAPHIVQEPAAAPLLSPRLCGKEAPWGATSWWLLSPHLLT